MLEIIRFENQKFRIGDKITVEIISVKGGKVLVGIDAPKNIEVHREEIYQKIKTERVEEILNDARKKNVRINRKLVRALTQSANDSVIPEDTINY